MPSGPGTGHYLSTETAVRLATFVVDSSNDPSTGDTVTYALYSTALGQRLDFADDTFKASPGTGTAAMAQLDATELPGMYLATLDLTGISNLSANDTLFALPLALTGKDPPPIEIRVDQWVADIPTILAGVVVIDGIVDGIETNVSFLRGLKDRYLIDGGAGSANATVDSGGLMTAGRIRIFASSGAATAATAGAADDADSETNRITVTASAQSAGVIGNGLMVTG